MCGIAGKLDGTGPVDPELLARMCEVIEHRGPDSRGTWCNDGVALGVQRLAVIDLETGDQPIGNEDGSVVVVLNGEIYNFHELRADLERNGHRFATRTDTEVIVHLYEDLGDACVERLRGMFAFALWDTRRRRLLLARDRVGKKPLFYAHRGRTLWFASEPKSILQDPAVQREVNLEAVDAFLHYGYVPHPASAFAGLRKLPPAHVLAWHDGRLETRRYWELSYRRDPPPGDERDWHERIREELLEATRLRMRSDVPLGAFLSGGVDSSAVVAAMARQASERVKTFAIGFDGAEFDETPYAREVADLLGTEHREFRVRPDALESLPQLIWHYGEPFADSSAIPSFYLAEVTRRHVTVALNGDGGDESFAGYSRYVSALQVHRMRGLPRPLAVLGRALFGRVPPGDDPRSARIRLRKLFERLPLTPLERYEAVMLCFTEAERRALYTPELLERIELTSARSAFQEAWEDCDADDPTERLLGLDVMTYLPGDLLVKMDIATMAHSLEVRSPLLDHRFMELAASLPGTSKLNGTQTKRVFKDALRPWLPDRVLDRRKMGFAVPLAEWLRGPLRALPEDVLLDPGALERGWFRPERLRELIDQHRSGHADHAEKLWALLQLELWQRTYLDGGTPRAPALSIGSRPS